MTHGMVCAPQPEAVEAGALALKRGGNAVDAAIACACAQTVGRPADVRHRRFRQHPTSTCRARACTVASISTAAPRPRPGPKCGPRWWSGRPRTDSASSCAAGSTTLGYQAVTTPGSLGAFHQALTRHGTLDWKQVLEPAIALAEEGFMIRPHVHDFWTRKEAFGLADHIERLRLTPSGRRIYFDEAGGLRGNSAQSSRTRTWRARLGVSRDGGVRGFLPRRDRRGHGRRHGAQRRPADAR